MTPPRIGITGVVSYARQITDLLTAPPRDQRPLDLVAVTTPDLNADAERLAELAELGVQTEPTYQALIARRDLDAVWLPLPIDLHVAFAEQALRTGKAVICEKPVAATVDDVDHFIQVRDETGLPVAIGFHTIYDPATIKIKRMIRDGVIGKVSHITVLGCWPRNENYYARASWSGKVRRDGRWVLDSPAQNAMAHFINLPLFWMGAEEAASASPLDVEAELYRAKPIENYDTCTMRYHLDAPGTPTLLVCMTHACREQDGIRITVVGERGKLSWSQPGGRFIFNDGKELPVPSHHNPRACMIGRLSSFIRGEDDPNAAVATLESGRCHVVAVNGASEATPVVDVPANAIEMTEDRGYPIRVIPGIESAMRQCEQQNILLHESGLVPWSVPAGHFDLRNYRHFTGGQFSASTAR